MPSVLYKNNLWPYIDIQWSREQAQKVLLESEGLSLKVKLKPPQVLKRGVVENHPKS